MQIPENRMPRILVLYYSAYGHTEALARAVADGAREVAGAQVEIMRVPELVPEALARASGYRLDQLAPVASTSDLAAYDAVLIGTPSRFGAVAAQMRSFLDRAGDLWQRRALMGKLGSVFLSNATQQLNPEHILQSIHDTLLHHGMRVISPTLVDEHPDRAPGPKALELARAHGRTVAAMAKRAAA
jgi:NAD(P)H dehydrogenase (quinone)